RTPTMPETTDDGSAELDRWLDARHAALLGDLARTLDLDAGLRDGTLPARHTDLLGDLAQVLDVDAGVAALLPAPPPPEPRPHPPQQALPDAEPAHQSSAPAAPFDRLIPWLTSLNDRDRLTIRNEPWLDVFDAYLAALACRDEIRRTVAFPLGLDLARDLARVLDRALATALTLATH